MDTNLSKAKIIALLDAFDAAATNLVHLFRSPRGSYWGPMNEHWSWSGKCSTYIVDFLSLAMMWNLAFYVEAKLEQDPSLVFANTGSPQRVPLLANTFLSGTSVNIEITEFLLKHSANPNELFGGHSLWQYLVHILHTAAWKKGLPNSYAPNDRQILQRFLHAMLLSGADLNVSCIQGHGPWGHRTYFERYVVVGVLTEVNSRDLVLHGGGVIDHEPTVDETILALTTKSVVENNVASDETEPFEERHSLTQILKYIFNTKDEPSGADTLLALVERLKVESCSI